LEFPAGVTAAINEPTVTATAGEVAEHPPVPVDSISFNPDALLKGIENISKAETSNQFEEGVMPL
jgi:hypothetical protein